MGFFDVDTSWYNPHSIFIRKGSLLSNYVVDKIDNDEVYGQLIRRLCRYLTIDPLSSKSVDLSGKEVYQADLKDSLLDNSIEGTETIVGEKTNLGKQDVSNQCLFNASFNQEIKRMEQCYIFVHNTQNRPSGRDMGDIYIRIDIIVPDKYDTIYDPSSDFDIKRGDALCFLIDDMLNERTITDSRYTDIIGDAKFELAHNSKERLTKTSDDIVYSLIYKIPVNRMRVMNGNL